MASRVFPSRAALRQIVSAAVVAVADVGSQTEAVPSAVSDYAADSGEARYAAEARDPWLGGRPA